MREIEETARTTTRSPDGAAAATRGPQIDLLRRLQKTSLIVGVILSIPFATYWGIGAGSAWVTGIAWSLINIKFITTIIENVLTLGERDTRKIVLAMVLKFPVLYVVGYILLRNDFFPVIWLVAGFTWPFFVLFMKGAGRAYLKLDQTGPDN